MGSAPRKVDPAIDMLDENARLTRALADTLDEFVTDVTTICTQRRQQQAQDCCPYCGLDDSHAHRKMAHG